MRVVTTHASPWTRSCPSHRLCADFGTPQCIRNCILPFVYARRPVRVTFLLEQNEELNWACDWVIEMAYCRRWCGSGGQLSHDEPIE